MVTVDDLGKTLVGFKNSTIRDTPQAFGSEVVKARSSCVSE